MALLDLFRRSDPTIVEAPPPLEPVQPDKIPSPTDASNATRPGKFKIPSDFASLEPQSHLIPSDEFPPHYTFEEDPVDFSQIVHISHHDPDSSLHDRIMLVVRRNTTSLTCLGFCTHKRAVTAQHSAHHAKPTATGTAIEEIGQDPEYFKVYVSLEEGQPKKDVYINMKDQWNVPRGSSVKFAVLGHAEAKTFPDVLWKMLEISAESLGLDLKDYGKRTGAVEARVVLVEAEPEGDPVVVVAGSGRRHQHAKHAPENERGKRKGSREASREKSGSRNRSAKVVTALFNQYT